MTRPRGVIVYLAQSKHSSYGRDSMSMLLRSVALLMRFYNAAQRDDMWFAHTGDVPADEQAAVLRRCHPANATFVQLDKRRHFILPPGAARSKANRWIQPKFSAGYRHMIRFYTIGLWPLVAQAGYEYVMRMDEDSWLWSPIRYNLFEFMQTQRLLYAYRVSSLEMGHRYWTGGAWHRLVSEYTQRAPRSLAERVEKQRWLLESCAARRRGSDALEGISSVANFTLERCGAMNGPYNNFFISKVSFWLRDDVQHFLAYVDRSNTIYTHRFNDILWHGAAIRLFMSPQHVHLFRDFSYEHLTVMIRRVGNATESCIPYGALALGNVTGAAADVALRRLGDLTRRLVDQDRRIAESVASDYRDNFYTFCARVSYCFSTRGDPPQDGGLFVGGAIGVEDPSCSLTNTCSAMLEDLGRRHLQARVDVETAANNRSAIAALLDIREQSVQRGCFGSQGRRRPPQRLLRAYGVTGQALCPVSTQPRVSRGKGIRWHVPHGWQVPCERGEAV